MTFLVLVVLYKTRPRDSDTLRTLAQQIPTPNVHMLVWDNSPDECDAEERQWIFNTFVASEYRHTGDNWPLSRIYNYVIDDYLRHPIARFDYLILFDQDSLISADFLVKATRAVANHPEIGLLLPIVFSGAHIVSPAHLYYFKGFYWKQKRTGVISSRFTSAINSGMVISATYLTSSFSGYPEALKFYGTDTFLCQAYAKHCPWLYVIDTTIRHDLARFREESADVKLWRHRETISATCFINRAGRLRGYACTVYAHAVSLRTAIKQHDLRFLRW